MILAASSAVCEAGSQSFDHRWSVEKVVPFVMVEVCHFYLAFYRHKAGYRTPWLPLSTPFAHRSASAARALARLRSGPSPSRWTCAMLEDTALCSPSVIIDATPPSQIAWNCSRFLHAVPAGGDWSGTPAYLNPRLRGTSQGPTMRQIGTMLVPLSPAMTRFA